MQGQDLRKLRRGTLDLTQEELAEKIGRSTRTVSAYENGDEPIPPGIALAVECLVIHHHRAIKAALNVKS